VLDNKILVQTGGIQAQFRLQHIGGFFIEINKLDIAKLKFFEKSLLFKLFPPG
jgi:hypothetical protein